MSPDKRAIRVIDVYDTGNPMLMSGHSQQFEKQDQKRLSADWMTGFDNRDRLAWLEQAVKEAEADLATKAKEASVARKTLKALQMEKLMLERLVDIRFERIDVLGIERLLDDLGRQLAALVDPESDTAKLKRQWEQGLAELDKLESVLKTCQREVMRLEQQVELAERELGDARARVAEGLSDEQRTLGETHFTAITEESLGNIVNIEREQSHKLQERIDTLGTRLTDVRARLSQGMSDAKSADRGALSDVGRELDQFPIAR